MKLPANQLPQLASIGTICLTTLGWWRRLFWGKILPSYTFLP